LFFWFFDLKEKKKKNLWVGGFWLVMDLLLAEPRTILVALDESPG
jgi:hypothetical protein